MKKYLLVFSLITAIVFSSSVYPVCSAEKTGRAYGDVDGNGAIEAADALTALQQSVGKIALGTAVCVYCDVSADGEITASDALNILQYSVKKISHFASEQYTEKELYYGLLEKQYGAKYTDYGDIVKIDDYTDAKELKEKLGGAQQPADVETWSTNNEGLLIYDQISREADKGKYQKAEKITGTVSVGDTVLSYSLPENVTAYDAVPIDYSVCSLTGEGCYVQATAYDDISRYADANADYYDNTLPDACSVDFRYDGYVAGTYYSESSKPVQTFDTEGDVIAATYPDYQCSQLIKSGDIKSSDMLWFKFTYTNTGNTILDSEGNGAFGYNFILEKRNASGAYSTCFKSLNSNKILSDYLYPGESGEAYFAVYAQNSEPFRLEDGEYRIVINGSLRMQTSQSTWPWGYNTCGVTRSEFNFSVSQNGSEKKPDEVLNKSLPCSRRSSNIGVFEEFMGSYNKHRNLSSNAFSPTEGTIYVQVAPWSKHIVIRLLNESSGKIKTVKIPINTESDSVKLELNPYNTNYYVKEDGTRTPLVQAMNMVDMRKNIDLAPDVSATIINELLDMKEAGINNIATTQSMTGDYTGLYDMTWFMMDAARKLKLNVEGSTLYYYRSSLPSQRVISSGTNEKIEGTRDIFNMNGIDSAQGILARLNLIRYGDTYYYGDDGCLPIAVEDNWGWFGGALNNRYACTGSYFNRSFKKWLQSLFGTVDKLNSAYNSSYSSFDEVSVESDGVKTETSGYSALMLEDRTKTYFDWNEAVSDLDLFRTSQRVNGYKDMLNKLGVKKARIALRFENNTFLASGISPDTANVRLRYIYFEQRRGALIPEVISASDTVFSDTAYCSLSLSNRELFELVRQTEKSGFVSAKLYTMAHLIDPVVTKGYGNSAKAQYNLESTDKVQYLCSAKSLFTYFKSVYEAGGIPGLMWDDYACDCFLTATQYKELMFFKEKTEEMLSTKEGQSWSENFNKQEPEFSSIVKGAYSYDQGFVEASIKSIDRYNVFESCHKKIRSSEAKTIRHI